MTTENVTVVVAGDPGLGDPLRAPEFTGVHVIDHVPTGNEAVARVLQDLPDVLFLDTRLEEPDARAVCRRLREWAPATKVLAATRLDDENAYTTVVAGAFGAVFLDDHDETVARAIRDVSRGEASLQARMALRLLHDIDAWTQRSADPLYPPPTLTATEREVLGRIGEGVDSAASHSVTAHLVNLHAGFAVAKLHRYVHGAERIAAAEQQ
ncbi:MAG: hypothetical protein P8J50_06160 [Acidimicrobiales bacterium]|nr:hypothetical protein [Acidimicrobiales bacterium]